jgi:lysophospholipase L1-like esterase
MLLLCSTLIGVVLSEGVLRIFAPQPLTLIRPDVWCPDDRLGWKHCPNVNAVIDSGEGEVVFQTDISGYRIDSSRVESQPEVRILAIGDSYVEAIQVKEHETVTARIAKALGQKYQRRVSVVNAGVSGWDPNQYLIQVKLELSQKKYDLGLVFLYLANDIVSEVRTEYEARKDYRRHRLRFPDALNREEFEASILYPINVFFERHSHLFVCLKRRFPAVLAMLGLTGYRISPLFQKDEAGSSGWAVTASICRKIRDEFELYGASALFVFIPADYQVDELTYATFLGIREESVDIRQPNRLLGERMQASGLDLIDPLEKMIEVTAKGKLLYGRVDRHFNALGHEVLSKNLLPAVEEKLSRLLWNDHR